jgi:gamma-glutamyl-gamma-aminobutyrate hydrolase PuuD
VGSNVSDAAGDGEAWPRIGLPTYVESARWGMWNRPAALLPHSYITAVMAAGGLPVMLPPLPAGTPTAVVADAARSAVGGLDGLLLTGGADIDPALYGASPLPTTQAPRPDRDAWEMALLATALDRDLPLLAVCRGIEVLNVARGGTLTQHLPDVVGHPGHLPEPGVFGTSQVRFAEGSPVAAILGPDAKVPCFHHQAVDRLADDVEAVGWADDGTVEAAIVPGRRFAVAVQWHPEESDDPRLFQALVAAARSAQQEAP